MQEVKARLENDREGKMRKCQRYARLAAYEMNDLQALLENGIVGERID